MMSHIQVLCMCSVLSIALNQHECLVQARQPSHVLEPDHNCLMLEH